MLIPSRWRLIANRIEFLDSPIVAGTDPTGRDALAQECHYMHKAELIPMEVVVTATRTGAELVRIQNRLGNAGEGKIAGFIAPNANPL